jgi:hypothetical protein
MPFKAGDDRPKAKLIIWRKRRGAIFPSLMHMFISFPIAFTRR